MSGINRHLEQNKIKDFRNNSHIFQNNAVTKNTMGKEVSSRNDDGKLSTSGRVKVDSCYMQHKTHLEIDERL